MMETAFELSDTVARLKVPIAKPPPVRQLANRYGGPDSRTFVNWQVCQFETAKNLLETLRGLSALGTQGYCINSVLR